MASFLSDRFRCVSLDLRGHGLSELPSTASLAWSGMAGDVLAVLNADHFPVGPLHGIGHSMGGAALVLAAAQRSGAFRSLWLYEPVIVPAEARLRQMATTRCPKWRLAVVTGSARSTRPMRIIAAKPPLDQLHPDALRAYVDGGFSSSPDGSVSLRCRPSTEAEVFRQAAASGAWGEVAALEIPVAIIAGRLRRHWAVAFAPAIADALARGTFIEKPNLGHFGPLEDPAAMAQDVSAWVRAHP